VEFLMMHTSHEELVAALSPQILSRDNGVALDYIIYTDSRQSFDQGLFWPLKGEKFDGHSFLSSVVRDSKARAIITQYSLEELSLSSLLPCDLVVYKVKDTLEALQKLSRYRAKVLRDQGVKIVGITGSSGKTTCKEFTNQIGQACGLKIHSNKGSFNNHFGVPFNILSAPPGIDVLLCEMGMNHGGELTDLSDLAQPSIVCCTMVGTAHIEHFGSVDKIAEAKEEIYKANPTALGIFNQANSWTRGMAQRWQGPQITFEEIQDFSESADPSKEAHLSKKVHVSMRADVTKEGFLKISGWIQDIPGEVILSLFGRHHVVNIMAASAIQLSLGVSPEKIWKALHHLKTPWGRTQILSTEIGATLLFDAYNANPESMTALFQIVKEYPLKGRRVWALLGEMKELGDQSPHLHYNLGLQVGSLGLDSIVFVGKFGNNFEQGYRESYQKKGCQEYKQQNKIQNNQSNNNQSNNNQSNSNQGNNNQNNKETFFQEEPQIKIFDSYEESLGRELGSMLKSQDFLIIKGSRGVQLERFVPFFKPLSFESKI
jgi:UDP-N-acetylmuramoyl-tripeptide--D-alanyl-D-alanine ligase